MIHFSVSLYLFSFVVVTASPREFLRESDEWFNVPKGSQVRTCILSRQSTEGDWPKNKNGTRVEFTGDRSKISQTFGNRATTDGLCFLARAFRVTGDVRCRNSVLAGLDHILKAWYPHGVDCITKCQILVNDVGTARCAPHDQITFAPAPARKYELVSLSGSERAGILMFLMSFEDPSQEGIRSVNGGVSWFEVAQIKGLCITETGGETNVVKDPSVPAVWARYEPGEIEVERRNGYQSPCQMATPLITDPI